MSFIIIVPARGGSKRIRRKNLAEVGGKPLISWTLDLLSSMNLQSQTIISSEDKAILELAEQLNFKAFCRSEMTASDTASTESVLLEVLNQYKHADLSKIEWVVTLQPTSPFRKAETLRWLLEQLDGAYRVDGFFSVTANLGDFWIGRGRNLSLDRLFPDAPRRQQDREPLFEENSAYYATRVKSLVATGSILGPKGRRHGFDIEKIEGFDVNEPFDLLLANALVEAKDDIYCAHLQG